MQIKKMPPEIIVLWDALTTPLSRIELIIYGGQSDKMDANSIMEIRTIMFLFLKYENMNEYFFMLRLLELNLNYSYIFISPNNKLIAFWAYIPCMSS